MPLGLSAVTAAEFDTQIKLDYQGRSKIAPLVDVRRNVRGATQTFYRHGKGMAKRRNAPQSDVVAMNTVQTPIVCTLENWDASDYTDIFQQSAVSFEERAPLARTVGLGLGRRADQLVIDALIAETLITKSVATSVGGADSGMNIEKLIAAKALFDTDEIEEGLVMIVHAQTIASMLGDTKITSSDFAAIRALVNGEINTFMGFNFVMIGDRDEGGLPTAAGDVRTNFVFARGSVGFAEGAGIGMPTEINYIPTKKSWLVSGHLRAGACVIDPAGCAEVLTDET